MASVIRPCTCKSVFQDKTYGASMRVFNTCKLGNNARGGLRCTVCLREIQDVVTKEDGVTQE